MFESAQLPQDLIDQFVGVAHGDFAQVKALLEKQPVLLNSSASWKETAIEAAAQTGQVEIVHFLLQAGAPLDICTAAMLGDLEKIRSMLSVDPGLIHSRGAHGLPLMYFPVIRNQKGVAAYLLQSGADINAGSTTALHCAVMFSQPEMIEWLLEHRANPNARNNSQKTPLDLAVENGKDDIAELLKKHQEKGK